MENRKNTFIRKSIKGDPEKDLVNMNKEENKSTNISNQETSKKENHSLNKPQVNLPPLKHQRRNPQNTSDPLKPTENSLTEKSKESSLVIFEDIDESEEEEPKRNYIPKRSKKFRPQKMPN